jgi:Cys-tRNA(Pro)/Cys-tRNA(Cys) deacylase
MAKKPPAGTPATTALTQAGVPHTVHSFEAADRTRGSDRGPRTSFGLEAAGALGVDPERVFKTLLAEVDDALWVAVVPVVALLDLKALAAAAGGKRATMADPATAERSSGYVVGGISPLGQRRRLPTVIDETALLHDTVFISGGRRGLDLELAPADLVAQTCASIAAIARQD